ncbi:MAG: HD domain-containing protein [Oscillospiraceae bacterium]|nr:HD domain-containing protein [Oscillospiraceae bacterium]
MKNIPLRIFILILIAGIIGIVGVSILTIDITVLSDTYNDIINDHTETLKTTSDIRSLMYKHQSIISKHISADNEQKFEEYEAAAGEIEVILKAEFSQFGEKMKGGEREQIYHEAYTSYLSYLSNSKTALNFSVAGQDKTANYYVVYVMDDSVRSVNEAFDRLDKYAEAEITSATEKMNSYIEFSTISAFTAIPVIAAAVIICSISCFKITSNLNSYKNKLEIDIINKNKALHEHDEKMLQLQNSTIIGMATLIESRDGDTGEHVKRTSVYVAMLAQAAKLEGYEVQTLTDSYIELLIKAAPLHDIGKIAVSDTILLKPSRLTQDEFEKMKYHALEGGRIVRNVIGGIGDEEYIGIASDVAAYHHEKWDGSGYNKGLSGTDIPLCARIMAIADVFDALISKRCYKEKYPLDEAFKIIGDSAGTHFDPTLTAIFLHIRPQIEAYLNSIKE